MTLVTDYGPGSDFVGSLHAVIYRIAPGTRVIDFDHRIPPGDVTLGALRLERMTRYVPPGVHVGIVDPGVGSRRLPVALATSERIFVGPDNGLLCWAAEACGGVSAAVVLDDERYVLQGRSTTFDGRDLFAPAAAHLAGGADITEIGSAIEPERLVSIERPRAIVDENGRSAVLEVTQVDGFGNVQLSGDASTARRLGLEPGVVVSTRTWTAPHTGAGEAPAASGAAFSATFATSFSDVGTGALVLLVDSDGALGLSANRGRADALLGIVPWTTVRIERAGPA
ncbi:MAG: SAM hydrolase/SAM-dependent halogenase family protein [Acidimicrobiales bacterium]